MLDTQDIQKLTDVLTSKTDITSLDERMIVITEKQDRVTEILNKFAEKVGVTLAT